MNAPIGMLPVENVVGNVFGHFVRGLRFLDGDLLRRPRVDKSVNGFLKAVG
jgi:hypothetical protein